MKVYKFGGASVKDADGVRNLLDIVRPESELFIIVSAMGKTTNALERVFEAMQRHEPDTALERVAGIRDYHKRIIDDLYGAPTRIMRVELLFEQLCNTVRNTIYRTADAELWYDTIVAFGELISTTIVSGISPARGRELLDRHAADVPYGAAPQGCRRQPRSHGLPPHARHEAEREAAVRRSGLHRRRTRRHHRYARARGLRTTRRPSWPRS